MKKSFSISLPEELLKDLEKLAEKCRRSRANMIEVILVNYFHDLQTGKKTIEKG